MAPSVSSKSSKKASSKESASTEAPAEQPAPTTAEPTPVVSVVSRVTRAGAQDLTEEPPFDDEFIEVQRQALVSERATYLRQSEVLQAEADSLTENREQGDTQFDEESGEGDGVAVERERDLALSQQALAAVEQIEAALERIEAGTYGICRVSGMRIPRARLEAIPWATERVEHKVGGFGRR